MSTSDGPDKPQDRVSTIVAVVAIAWIVCCAVGVVVVMGWL